MAATFSVSFEKGDFNQERLRFELVGENRIALVAPGVRVELHAGDLARMLIYVYDVDGLPLGHPLLYLTEFLRFRSDERENSDGSRIHFMHGGSRKDPEDRYGWRNA